MNKDTFYFSHDYNTRNDSKIKKLLFKHGYQGYGIFWAIIEDLYNNANALPTDYDSIAYDLRTDKNIVESVIKDFDLFVFNDGFFGSISVQKRLDERDSKSEKARESARYRWSKKIDDANALPMQSDSNAIKERKVKEKKVKESIQLKTFVRENVSLLDEEIEKLVSVHGKEKTDWMFDKLNNYKIASGRKYRSDYHAILQWVVGELKNYKPNSQQNLETPKRTPLPSHYQQAHHYYSACERDGVRPVRWDDDKPLTDEELDEEFKRIKYGKYGMYGKYAK
jgi:hypothetical protein